jgi:hypothetical protein
MQKNINVQRKRGKEERGKGNEEKQMQENVS